MRNVSNKICRENQKHRFYVLWPPPPPPPENRAVYAIMSKNVVKPLRPQTVLRMRVVCWVSKATRAPASIQPHTQICVIRTVFFTATMASRTRPSVTLHVRGLSYIFLRPVYYSVLRASPSQQHEQLFMLVTHQQQMCLITNKHTRSSWLIESIKYVTFVTLLVHEQNIVQPVMTDRIRTPSCGEFGECITVMTTAKSATTFDTSLQIIC
jgi:hypothetical protein